MNTKIQSSTDALGNPLRFLLTGGEQSDYQQALNLIDKQDADFVLADKGYDADYIIAEIIAKGAQAVIPPKYDKLASSYLSFVLVAAIHLWLK